MDWEVLEIAKPLQVGGCKVLLLTFFLAPGVVTCILTSPLKKITCRVHIPVL
jgi:hypothetical protein